ncbi:C2 family cysteine protease [Actinotalea sp. K2]|uniref:C2 family cysteine protease n=1 Tax=Actinotalea sp. K2 TaxID=2939438 RepID=UPI002017425F|nr:C2 family cysteine protease [Actinotalea sp. K2]MCL3860035.1 C2 family cysteine protease [Actinotalea sp. K2]
MRTRGQARTVTVGGDRGSGTLEYLGIVVVAALLVVAAVTAVVRTDVGETVACQLRSIASQAGTCGAPEVPTTYGDAGDGPAAGAPGAGGDSGGDAGEEPPAGVHYVNASDPPEVDPERVQTALDDLRDALDGGFWGVRGGDLADARDAVSALNGAEVDALIAGMTDDELAHWISQMEDGWLFGGWDREDRRELWEVFASKASKETLDRLAGLTDELEPRFDGVGGDSARDNPQSPANSGEYGEIPHQLVVDGIAPGDVSQGQIGDCWFIASLMAIAQADPSVIEDAITVNDNGTYTVRLYDDGREVEVTVTPEMVLDGGNPAFVRSPAGEDGHELWPMVMEKALALHWGDFHAIEGDSPGLGLELVTGVPSERRSLDDAGGAGSLADYLAEGGAVTLATFTESDDNPDIYHLDPSSGGLASNHAYYVSAVDVENGTVTVTNPWGAGWPTVTMTYGEFEDSFSSIYFNEVAR